MISKFFKEAAETKIVKNLEDLNPNIIRFLKCVQQIEVGHLHNKFKEELTKYLHFLLRFANQEESFRKTPIYRSKELEKINLEISRVPMIRLDAVLVKIKNKK